MPSNVRTLVTLCCLAVLSTLCQSRAVGADAFQVWLTHSTNKVSVDSLPPSSAVSHGEVSWRMSAARGERESFQVAVRVGDMPLDVEVATYSTRPASLGSEAPLPVAVAKVVSVDCQQSSLYNLSGGWQPDVLMPLATYFKDGSILLEANTTHTFYVSVDVPLETPAADYTVEVNLTDSSARPLATISASLVVHNVALPSLRAPYSQMFNFFFQTDDDGATDLKEYYNEKTLSPLMRDAYFAELCDQGIPPDDLYLAAPRNITEYLEMVGPDCGATRFNLLDVTTMLGPRPGYNYTSDDAARVVDALEAIAADVVRANLTDAAYVYGFDEVPATAEHAIRLIFGAVKARYPWLRTVATLRWEELPNDLPLDTWVQLYPLWNETKALAWQSSGARRETVAYHCISPRDEGWMNTFLESPGVHPRLLSWWASINSVQGWLYYLVDGWSATNDHNALDLLAGSTSLTNFTATRPNGKLKGFSNGDGIFIYPGTLGPLSSTRLARWRDGLEDRALLAMLDRDTRESFVRQLVRSGQDVTDDPALVDKIHADILAAIAASVKRS